MAKITVSAAKAIRELTGYGRRMKNPEGGLKRVGQYVKGLAQQSFRDQSDPTKHDSWAELSDVTIELRKNKGRETTKILRDSDALMKSITHFITGKNKVVIGTPLVYGKMHQHGGTTSPRSMIPGKRIPARPFLGIDKAGEREITNIIKRYILEGTR